MEKTTTSIQTDLKKDSALKDHFKNKQNFADIINAVLFNSHEVVKAKDLHDYDSDMSTIMALLPNPLTLDRNRDIIMKAGIDGIYALIAIENQSAVDYTMPLRVLVYDACAYNQQYQNIEKLKKKGISTDSIKLLPIYTIVLYYGEQNWTAPLDLHGMMEIPDELKPYINNWHSNVLDVKKESWVFHEKDNQDLFTGLQRFYQWNGDINTLKDLKMDKATALVLASLINKDEILEIIEDEEGDEINMCTSVDLAFKKEFEKGINQGIDQGKLSVLMNLLKQRFGSLSKQTITNLETSSSEKLDRLSLNIFDLTNEDDINDLLLN